MKRYRVTYESKNTPALRDPKKPAQRIYSGVSAGSPDEARKIAGEAEVRHAMRCLKEAAEAEAGGNKDLAKFLRQRADLDAWKHKKTEEMK